MSRTQFKTNWGHVPLSKWLVRANGMVNVTMDAAQSTWHHVMPRVETEHLGLLNLVHGSEMGGDCFASNGLLT